MTCKHPKSSRVYDFIVKNFRVNIKINEKLMYGNHVRDDYVDFIEVKFIRTICANCGKVLKEVKVIEK